MKPVDLSVVDPKGRLDVLASRLIERAVCVKAPVLLETYQEARPMIDGALVAVLGHVGIPHLTPPVVDLLRLCGEGMKERLSKAFNCEGEIW